jgi:hypothetical protein
VGSGALAEALAARPQLLILSIDDLACDEVKAAVSCVDMCYVC